MSPIPTSSPLDVDNVINGEMLDFIFRSRDIALTGDIFWRIDATRIFNVSPRGDRQFSPRENASPRQGRRIFQFSFSLGRLFSSTIPGAVRRDGHGPDFFGLGWAQIEKARPSPAQPVGRPIWVKPGPNRRIEKKHHILTNENSLPTEHKPKFSK